MRIGAIRYHYVGYLVLSSVCGCLDPSSHESATPERDLNHRAILAIENEPAPSRLQFAVLGDVHLDVDDIGRAADSINRNEGIAFVVQIGDVTHSGTFDEFMRAEEALASLRVPHLVVVGNHDYQNKGIELYRSMYGPENDSFAFARTQFVLADTNSIAVAGNGGVPDIPWLEATLASKGEATRAVVFSHIPPDHADFAPALVEPFVSALEKGGVVLSVHGHEHRFRRGAPFHDGVEYVVADRLSSRTYVLFTEAADSSGFEVEQVTY